MEFNFRRALARGFVATVAAASVALAGCSAAVYKVTGDTMNNIGQDVMLPYLLTTDDTVIACASGEALTPLLLSFSTVTTPPDELEVLMSMVGGACATNRAFDHEMLYLRHSREKNITSAQDERILSKRWHAMAAARYYKGYQALVRALGEPGEKCPMFENDFQQLIWLMGAGLGLQAALSDVASNMQVGVPFSVAPKAERAAGCLDTAEGNKKWWGLPKGIRAALWTIVPGITPQGMDPWQELTAARQIGIKEGVRFTAALDALVSNNISNTERVRSIIREHASVVKTTAANKDYRLVDILAGDQMLQMSDRMWMQATGTRTPIGAYGTFWDEKPAQPKLDQNLMDDLL